MVSLCRTNETCRQIAKLPGVGPVVATAIVAAVAATDRSGSFRSTSARRSPRLMAPTFSAQSRSTVSWPIFSYNGASCASAASPSLADRLSL